MFLTLGGIIIILDILVSMFAVLLGKYDIATYYIVLGILYVLIFDSREVHYISKSDNENEDDDYEKEDNDND